MSRKRALLQKDGSCGLNHHSCFDVGFGTHCCENKDYCYVNNQFHPACCPLGSECIGNSPCESTAYFCSHTVVQTPPTTPSVQTGCCGRKCPEPGYHLCAKSLGGNCCKFGADCVPGGCVVPKPSPSPSATAKVEQHQTLDSRAKVAIGLSLGFSLLLGISLLIWCIWKRRKTPHYQNRLSDNSSNNASVFASCGSSSPELNARRHVRRRTDTSILAAVPIFRFANEQDAAPASRSTNLYELDSLEVPPPRSPSILQTPVEYLRRSLQFTSKN